MVGIAIPVIPGKYHHSPSLEHHRSGLGSFIAHCGAIYQLPHSHPRKKHTGSLGRPDLIFFRLHSGSAKCMSIYIASENKRNNIVQPFIFFPL